MTSTALTTSSQAMSTGTNGLATLQDGAYLELLLHRFAASQDVAPSSRGTYLRTVRQFFRWVGEQGLPLSTLTRAEVLRYKEDLLAGGMSSLSVGAYLTSVRRFFAWAEGEKVYPNIARDVKGPKRKQQFRKQALPREKAKEVLSLHQGQDIRGHAILNLLLRTGLRTIEVVRANVEDITYKGTTRVLLVHGKGRAERDAFVILTDAAYQPIADYLATRGKVKAGEPLFTSASNNSKGGRLTTRTVSRIAKESFRSVGLDGKEYTAHSTRHTAAVTLMRAGSSLEEVQHVLRHSSPATTQIYTATIKEELRLRNSTESLLDQAYA